MSAIHTIHPTTLAVLLALATALPTASAAAQSVLVDINGRGDYTEISTAVEKVPSGTVIRVNYSTLGYRPFSVTNKSVTIVGLPQPASGARPGVHIPGAGKAALQIGPLRAQDRVVIRNLEFVQDAVFTGAPVQVQKVQGSLAVRDCEFKSSAAGADLHVRIDGSQNVHFSDTQFQPGAGALAGNDLMILSNSSVELTSCVLAGKDSDATAVRSGALQASGSRVVLFETAVRGGRGYSATSAKSDGGPAIALQNGATLFAAGRTAATVIAGGTAGSDGTGAGANGGDGVVLTGGSLARIEGFVPTGGLTGQGGNPGLAVRPDQTSKALVDANSKPPIHGLTGTPQSGSKITYTLDGAAGTPAILLIGFAPLHFDVGFAGPLLVEPLATVSLSVPATPPLQFPVTVPTGLGVGTAVFTQFGNQVGGTVWASNSVATILQ